MHIYVLLSKTVPRTYSIIMHGQLDQTHTKYIYINTHIYIFTCVHIIYMHIYIYTNAYILSSHQSSITHTLHYEAWNHRFNTAPLLHPWTLSNPSLSPFPFCFLMRNLYHAQGQQTWATSLDTSLFLVFGVLFFSCCSIHFVSSWASGATHEVSRLGQPHLTHLYLIFFGVLFFSLCTSILFPQRKVVPGTRSEDFCNTCLTHIYVQFFGSFFFSVFESILFPYRYVVPHYTPLFPPLRIPIFGLSRKSVSRTRFWSMGNIIAPFFFEIVLPMPHHRIYHYFGLFHFFGSNFFLFSSFLSFYLVSLGKWHHLTHLRFQLYSLLFFFFWLVSIPTLPSSYYLVSSGK